MGIKERNKKRILRKLRRPMMCFLSATFACSSILFAYASNIETDKTVLSWQWDIDDDSLSPLYVNNNDELVLDLSDKEELTEDDIADYLPQYIKADIMTYTEQTEEPIDETEDKPMDESVDEPTEEMIDEPVDKPTSEPIDELMDETVNETIDEPADELIEETTDEHTEELIDDPVDEPNEPIEEPVVGDTADKPTDETVGEPENELIDEPKDEPTDKMPKRIAPETTVYEEYIDITWDMSEIPEEMEDEFVLTASLPKGYSFGSGVPLPFVTVLTGGGIDGLSEVNPDDLTNGKYALVIGDSKAAMLAEQKEVDGKNGFAAIAVNLKTGSEPKVVLSEENEDEKGILAVWEFEKITENNKYYVKAETDGSYKYLKIDNANITLVDTEAEASAIEIQIGSGDNVGKIRLAGEGDYAPNLYGGSIARGFAGYNGGTADPNEWFYPIHENRVGTVKTVPGVSPNGTAITLFDYWLESEDSRDDRGYKEDINLINSGINQGHALKFLKDIPSDTYICGAMNTWTRSAAPCQGIVKNKLVDGYPYLNEDIIDKSAQYIKDCEAESLDYLFDPKTENAYRRVYQNAQGMLRVDEDGYYRYDCKENFAELDKETNTFTLYEAAGVTNHNDTSIVGQFFPFNKFADVSNEKCNSSKLNHYFGLTMKTRFVQKNGGMTENDNPAMFEFSGDDDVWIFIDDVLVADLGGNHDAVSVNINFVTGEVVINEGTNVEQKTTLYDQFGKVYDKDNDYLMSSEFWTKDETTGHITFADNTCHTFKFFYLERGNYASNMNMKYNFAQIPSSEFLKVDQYGEGVEGAELSLYAAEIDEKTGEYKIIEGQDPIYYGVTDSEGKLRLVDEDGLDMSFDDLVTMSDGKTHFVLKEVVPDGYRAVGTGVNLKIVNGTMVCENTINSGAWASANVLATAPDKLNLANKNVNIGDVVENGTVNFIDDGNENGSLFAVVLKYVGPRNDDGAANPADQGNLAYWRPVHGDPVNGYQLEEVGNEDKSFISAVIKAASEYNGNVFQLSQEGSVQCNIEELPGDIRDYYYMLKASGGDAEAAKAEYTVAYY